MACEQEQSDYRISVEPAGSYVRVFGSGSNSTANLLEFLAEAHRAVREHGCDSILLVLDFKGPSLSLGSIYTIVTTRYSLARGLRRIACVDTVGEHVIDRAELVELVANKLGINFRMFRSIEAAEAWLTDSH